MRVSANWVFWVRYDSVLETMAFSEDLEAVPMKMHWVWANMKAPHKQFYTGIRAQTPDIPARIKSIYLFLCSIKQNSTGGIGKERAIIHAREDGH